MSKVLFVYSLALFACITAYAQEAVSTLPALDNLADKIPQDGAMVTAIAAVVGFVLDLVLRLKGTRKPLDLLILIGKGFAGIGKIFFRLSNLMDKVLPQNSEVSKEELKK